VRQCVKEMAYHCPIEVTIEVIGGKWKPLILFALLRGTKRFGELKGAMPGITPRMLARQLRELEDDGLIHRQVYPEVPPKVEYSLTEVGCGLGPLIVQMDRWGAGFIESAVER